MHRGAGQVRAGGRAAAQFPLPRDGQGVPGSHQGRPGLRDRLLGLAMSAMPNPLVPPFPPAVIKTAQAAIHQGKAAKTQSPRETEYLAAIDAFFMGYDNTAYQPRAEAYEQAMQRLSEDFRDDSEARIFYALALNMAVDFDDTKFTKQLKAAAILNEEAKKNDLPSEKWTRGYAASASACCGVM